jgi:hypothetical protein
MVFSKSLLVDFEGLPISVASSSLRLKVEERFGFQTRSFARRKTGDYGILRNPTDAYVRCLQEHKNRGKALSL